jgi:type I restriction-modification system DNA methylase subunit
MAEPSPLAEGTPMASARKYSSAKTAATPGSEEKVWAITDALRGSMDAGEYKRVFLGIIFHKRFGRFVDEAMAGAPLKAKKQLTC